MGGLVEGFGTALYPEAARILAYLAVLCLLFAASVFGRNCLRTDRVYETYYPWPARLIVYIWYVCLPSAGLGTALYLYARGADVEQKRFARAAIFMSVINSLLSLAVHFGSSSAAINYVH